MSKSFVLVAFRWSLLSRSSISCYVPVKNMTKYFSRSLIFSQNGLYLRILNDYWIRRSIADIFVGLCYQGCWKEEEHNELIDENSPFKLIKVVSWIDGNYKLRITKWIRLKYIDCLVALLLNSYPVLRDVRNPPRTTVCSRESIRNI